MTSGGDSTPMRGLNLVYKTRDGIKKSKKFTYRLVTGLGKLEISGWQFGNIVAGRLSDGIVQLSFRSDQVTDRVGK